MPKTPYQLKLDAAQEVADRVRRGERKFSLKDVRDLHYGFLMLKHAPVPVPADPVVP